MKHLIITTIAAVLLVTTAFAGPIHEAGANGVLDGVQAELDKGVDVNVKGNGGLTPLLFAAWGHKEIAELLIAKGADVNAIVTGGISKGQTPLDSTRLKETADLLRKHGGKTGEELKAEGN